MNWSEAELFVKTAVTCTCSPNLYLVLSVRIVSFQSEAIVDTLYNLCWGVLRNTCSPPGEDLHLQGTLHRTCCFERTGDCSRF